MSDTKSSDCVGFTGLLAVLFVGLKLTHYIDWSWWWVLSPIWIPFGIALVCAILLALLKSGDK